MTTLGLLGTLTAYRSDKSDWTAIGETPQGWKAVFLKKVAEVMEQPHELVYLRQHSLMMAQASESKFMNYTMLLHPLLTPFTSFDAKQSRLLRFSLYLLQINLFALACMVYYQQSYRVEDPTRDPQMLDQVDIATVCSAIAFGAIFLMPIFDPVAKMLGNRIEVNDKEVLVVDLRLKTKITVIAFA